MASLDIEMLSAFARAGRRTIGVCLCAAGAAIVALGAYSYFRQRIVGELFSEGVLMALGSVFVGIVVTLVGASVVAFPGAVIPEAVKQRLRRRTELSVSRERPNIPD